MRLLHYAAELLKRLTPAWMGWGPGLLLYALLVAAVGSVVALDWAAKRVAERGVFFASTIGWICLGFVGLSFYVAVRRRGNTRFLHRFFLWAESIPLALALIVSLAYASIAGSVYSAVEPAYGKAMIFHSWWYLGLMAALAINLVLCSYESSFHVLGLPGRKDFRGSLGFYQSARHGAAVPFKGTARQALEAFKGVYGSGAAFDGKSMAYIQKGVFSRFGPTVVHIGLLIAMAAGGYRILSERIGLRYINETDEGEAIPSSDIRWMGLFDSQISIGEGESARRIKVKRDHRSPFSSENSRVVELDFEVKCHNFEAEMYPGTRTPRYFGSLLEITDKKTGDKKIATVDMNNAVSFKGYKFSQNSYSARQDIPRAEIEIVETATGRRHRIDVGPGARNKLAPKGELSRYQVEVDGFGPGAAWRIYDAQGDGPFGKPFAQGKLAGDASSMIAPIAFFRAFQMGSNGPEDVSADPSDLSNPAVILQIEGSAGTTDLVFLFLNPDLPAINAPKGLDIRLADIRPARADGALEKTGDVPPLPRTDGDTSERAAGEGKSRAELLAEKHRSTTAAHEYRVTIADAATGMVRFDDWVRLGAPTPVGGMGGSRVSEEAMDRHVAMAKAAGERFAVRYVGPATGYMTVLGVIRDPSLPYLYFGCLVVIFGVMQSFMFTYREAWLLHAPGMARIAMKARGSGDKPFEEFERLKAMLASVEGTGAAPPEVERAKRPDAPPPAKPADGKSGTPAKNGAPKGSNKGKKSAKGKRG